MMHVALVSPLFESVPPRLYGGTERVVANLCQGLRDAGIKVTLFASGDSKALEGSGELVSVVPEALRLAKRTVLDLAPYHLKMLAEVARRADEFDLIHSHLEYWMLPITQMVRVPLLTTLHGRLDAPDLAAAFESYPDARYISISDAQRKPFPHLHWLSTVHHGLDLKTLKFNPHPTGGYLAFLGRMSLEKRPDWAIEIAKKAGIPLKMAAKIEGGADRAYFEAVVKPQIDGRFIEFVGEICEAEKSEFLGNALGTLFPIDWPEPFGLVPIESLACGTPVLARPCGAAPELLRDGVTGYVHSSIDVLAKRVHDLPALDRRKCREWVDQRFSLKRMTEDYIHVYRRLKRSNRHRWDILHPVERIAHRNS